MKKLNPVFVLLMILFFTNNTYAKIWRVNNTPGVTADYTSVQTAFDAVTTLAGDTIHVEPSATAYGNPTLTKPLVIIGGGYFLTVNTGLQVNTNNSSFNYIIFNTGSAGSTMQGIWLNSVYLQTSNILVRRCYISGYFYIYNGANNCTIMDNYFTGISPQSGPVSGLNISNNIIPNTGISLGADYTSGIFENNTCSAGGVSLYNFQVDNNIFNTTAFTPNNCVYFNNIGSSTQFGMANGNQQNVTPMVDGVFVPSGTTDGQYQLKGGSPAIGAGFGGVDCGAFGGPNPYVLSGIPNVPTIYSLTVPPTGTTNINVTISTKSNN